MDFKQLEAFAAVVDYGSFSEACRRLSDPAYHQRPYPGSGKRTESKADHTHHQKTYDHHKRLSAL